MFICKLYQWTWYIPPPVEAHNLSFDISIGSLQVIPHMLSQIYLGAILTPINEMMDRASDGRVQDIPYAWSEHQQLYRKLCEINKSRLLCSAPLFAVFDRASWMKFQNKHNLQNKTKAIPLLKLSLSIGTQAASIHEKSSPPFQVCFDTDFKQFYCLAAIYTLQSPFEHNKGKITICSTRKFRYNKVRYIPKNITTMWHPPTSR